MAMYLHDGATTAHTAWTEEALRRGVADGVILSPFFTPRTPRRGQPDGLSVAARVRDANGHVFFDATTHGVRLPGANNFTSYNTWQLWGGVRGDLSSEADREAHVERVFERQSELSADHLTPTVALDNPVGADADTALALAEAGRQADPGAWQSLAGRRGFWLSDDLDGYVGALAQLRSPLWFVTHVREFGLYPPDMTEPAQVAAFCRTVDSLSRRSRVLVCHGDLFALPAVAAGARALGTGWHTKQRICSPAAFQQNDPDEVRRQALWLTYEGLAARLHSQDSEVLVNRERVMAEMLYAGPVVATNREARVHHLDVVHRLVAHVSAQPSPGDRVAALRAVYDAASAQLDDLARRFGPSFARQRAAFVDGPLAGLQMYAEGEGIWR